jgi:hypothetical protein
MNLRRPLLLLIPAILMLGCTTVEQRQLEREVLFTPAPIEPDASRLETALNRLHQNLESLFGPNLLELYETHAVLSIPDGVTLNRHDHLDLRGPFPKSRKIEIVFDNLTGCEIQLLKRPSGTRREAVLVLQQTTGYSGSLMGYGGEIITTEKGLEQLKAIAEDLLLLSRTLKDVTLAAELRSS